MTLIMIIPSRGRPGSAIEAARSASAGRARTDTEIIVAVDGDPDPDYTFDGPPIAGVAIERHGEHRGMVATLNHVAARVVRSRFVTHVGFMGDDHRVRTPGWDAELMKSAGPVGVAYADDLNDAVDLPTSVVLGANIVRRLGYMAPPALGHLYVDNFWRELGLSLGRLDYRPDVVIEHMHPTTGKAEWDAQYERVNSDAQFDRDEAAWVAYRERVLAVAVHRIKRAYPQMFRTSQRRPRPRIERKGR